MISLKKMRRTQAANQVNLDRARRAKHQRIHSAVNEMAQYRGKPVLYAEKVLGIKLWDRLAEVACAIHEPPYKVMVKSGHKIGKCVAVGEVITLADGRRVPAEDLVGQEFDLLTLVDGNSVPVMAAAAWNVVEPVYRVTTETGKQIVRNAAHPLWAADARFKSGCRPMIRNQGWRGAGSLAPGQVVAVPESLPAFGSDEMPEHEVKLLAYLIGDGGMTQNQLTFTQLDNEQLAEFRECCRLAQTRLTQSSSDAITYHVVSDGTAGWRTRSTARMGYVGSTKHRVNRVRDLIRRHGLAGKHSRDKFIPAAIFSLKKPLVAVFLSRLYATDGWASVDKNGTCEIGFCSISERLCREVHELLLRFGIHATLRRRPEVNAWCVAMQGSSECLTFSREIGIYGKEAALANVVRRALERRAVKNGRRWKTNPRHKVNRAPEGTRWEIVAKVEALAPRMTVAIEVPLHHTFLTSFYEHNTHLVATLINYWFDCFAPSIVLSTAPKFDHITKVLWKEVRVQRMRAGRPDCFIGPAAPEMRLSPNHWAVGTVAAKGESFQGQHEGHTLFIFDEAIGVKPHMWLTAKSMFKPNGMHAWLAIFNPTETTSEAYQQEQTGDWRVFSLSSLDHPNLAAERDGVPLPMPNAVEAAQVTMWVKDWCVPVKDEDRHPTDIRWKVPGMPFNWWRPGADFEARVLGKWPTKGIDSIWTEALFDRCCVRCNEEGDKDIRTVPLSQLLRPWLHTLPEIGCDVARFGDDKTAFHVRWGPFSLCHEEFMGLATTQTTARLIELAEEYADLSNELRRAEGGHRPRVTAQDIRLKVDDDGIGGACVDQLADLGYAVVAIRASSAAMEPSRYPNKRSELWFLTQELAAGSDAPGLWLGLLDDKTLQALKRQALAPRWKPLGGRRVVEPKEATKAKIGRSPDGMDALHLAHYAPGWEAPTVLDTKHPHGPDRLQPGPRERETPTPGGGLPWQRGRRDIYGR